MPPEGTTNATNAKSVTTGQTAAEVDHLEKMCQFATCKPARGPVRVVQDTSRGTFRNQITEWTVVNIVKLFFCMNSTVTNDKELIAPNPLLRCVL